MQEEDATLEDTRTTGGQSESPHVPALVILWSEDEPGRAGEVALIQRACVLGRGTGDSGSARARFLRQRPGRNEHRPALAERRLSRQQLRITPGEDSLSIHNVGRCPLIVNGAPVDRITAKPGEVLLLRTLALGVVMRPLQLADLKPKQAWGEPDPVGFVGETPTAWRLRRAMAFIGGREGHVLVLGASGSGKELAAQALHQHSPRARKRLVSRNAATLPEGLLDAELFGNIKDYPNPGMRERPGLVGEAEGSTLFLDEISEIPAAMHAHLLRLLDKAGEYHRLGEAVARRANVRVVAATNREPSALKHDLRARFRLLLELPGLNQRVADIPLLLTHMLRTSARTDRLIAERFVDDAGHPRVEARLVAALCQHTYTHHVRELDNLLWQAISTSDGERISLVGVQLTLSPPSLDVDPSTLDSATIQTALDAADGVLEKTWRDLGLKNRFQLVRLMKKHRLGRYASEL